MICTLSGPVLRDTARLSQRYPLLRAMGFLVSQYSQKGAIPPPWRACKVGVRYPPLQRGNSAILARYPMKTRQMGAIPPLRYYLGRVLRDMGGYLALGR